MLRKSFGNTIAEYGLILGLLVVAAIGALSLMGGSLSNLLGGTVNGAVGGGGSASAVVGLLAPVGGPGGTPASGSQTGNQQNPVASNPSSFNTPGTSTATNTTSVDGLTGSSQSLAMGETMTSLAASDPANASTLNQMANLLYLMGGVQGGYLETSHTQRDELRLSSNRYYDAKMASYDLQQMQGQLNAALQQLPPNSPSYAEASALVADAAGITQSYLGTKTYAPPAGEYTTYGQSANLSTIKATADSLLADNGGQPQSGAEGTFVDASKMDATTPNP